MGSSADVEPSQPVPDLRGALARLEKEVEGWPCLEATAQLDGREAAIRAWVPPELMHRRPALRRAPRWLDTVEQELPVVVATAPIERAAIPKLGVRDVVVVAPSRTGAELRVARGAVAVRVEAGGDYALIESGYVRRAMDPLSDDLSTELTVTAGTATMSLRQLADLAVGQVVSLGRPLHGPFELRVGAKIIGNGELVDLDGALGVRISSLQGE
jgi:hypothetical protein